MILPGDLSWGLSGKSMVIGEFGQEVLTGGGLKFELVQLNARFVSLWIVKRLKKQKHIEY